MRVANKQHERAVNFGPWKVKTPSDVNKKHEREFQKCSY